jgi:hypothetical protein
MTWRAAWRRPQRWRDSGRSSHSRGREQAHGLAVPADDQPTAVMFYPMHPAGRCRRLGGKGGNAGIDVPVRTRGSYPDQGESLWMFIWANSRRSSAVAPNPSSTARFTKLLLGNSNQRRGGGLARRSVAVRAARDEEARQGDRLRSQDTPRIYSSRRASNSAMVSVLHITAACSRAWLRAG